MTGGHGQRLWLLPIIGVMALQGKPAAAQIGIPYIADGPLPGELLDSESVAVDPPDEVEAGDAEPTVLPTSPPDTSPSYFFRQWDKRRELMTIDPAAAAALTQEIVLRKEAAGWPNFYVYAATCRREIEQALAQGDEARAKRLAGFAVALAPDSPEAHLALALAHWRARESAAALQSLASAVGTLYREPPLLRRQLGSVALSALLALLAAAGIFSLSLIYRYIGLLHHDLLHLLPRGVRPWLLGLAVAVAFMAPVLFRLGYTGTVAAWLVMLGLYFRPVERVAAILVLATLGSIPVVMSVVMRPYAYPGSLAEATYFGARSMEAVEIDKRFRHNKRPTGEQLYVLGLRSLWSGQAKEAVYWLQRAAHTPLNSPQLQTTLGNVHARLGANAEALAAYEAALKQSGEQHVLAWFNRSRILHLLAEEKRAGESFRRAVDLDPEAVERYAEGARDKPSAFVVAEGVPHGLLSMPVAAGFAGELALDQIWAWVGGRLQRYVFSVSAVISIMLLVIMAFLRGPARAASTCGRCGEPACRRCSHAMPDQQQCGQCYSAFVLTDKRFEQLRIQKEIAGHRYRASLLRLTRLLSIMIAGGGHLVSGALIRGLGFMLVFLLCVITVLANLDLIPTPGLHTEAFSPFATVAAAVAGLLCYAVSVWDGARDG